tara:strand:+ start:1170 stop:1601 length:432 start_codon:yes stop_codon:yes gene_type:complete
MAISRNITTEQERDGLVKFIMHQPMPFNATVADGRKRSLDQNKLQWTWAKEISEQRGDEAPDYYQRYNKLHYGVPILRAENEDYREDYDFVIKPLTYEQKMKAMKFYTVSSVMKTKQFSQYLDEIYRFWSGEGIQLTQPEQKT